MIELDIYVMYYVLNYVKIEFIPPERLYNLPEKLRTSII